MEGFLWEHLIVIGFTDGGVEFTESFGIKVLCLSF